MTVAGPGCSACSASFAAPRATGVLLNTSVNVAGRPILSTVAEAFQVFNATGLDVLLIEDVMIAKR